MTNTEHPQPADPAVRPALSWRRILVAVVVLTVLGAGAGSASGLVGGNGSEGAGNTGAGALAGTDPSPSAVPSDQPASPQPPQQQCGTGCATHQPDAGQQKTTVPAVVGKSEADARDLVTKRNLQPNVKYVCSGSGSLGTVTAQSPHGDSSVNPGSKVSLDVRGVTVPDVVGQYYGDAEHELKAAGLTVTTKNYQPGAAGGGVRTQHPAGHTCVKPGSPVNITVGQSPAPSTSTTP